MALQHLRGCQGRCQRPRAADARGPGWRPRGRRRPGGHAFGLVQLGRSASRCGQLQRMPAQCRHTFWQPGLMSGMQGGRGAWRGPTPSSRTSSRTACSSLLRPPSMDSPAPPAARRRYSCRSCRVIGVQNAVLTEPPCSARKPAADVPAPPGAGPWAAMGFNANAVPPAKSLCPPRKHNRELLALLRWLAGACCNKPFRLRSPSPPPLLLSNVLALGNASRRPPKRS